MRKIRCFHFTETKTDGEMLSMLREPTQDLSKHLRNPSSLGIFQVLKFPFLSCKALWMLSWMVHGVALTLACLQGVKLWCHGCLHVTFMATALSPDPGVDMVMPTFNAVCWMLASPRLNLSCQSGGVMLCNGVRAQWWCSCSRAQDKYLGRKLPCDGSSVHTSFGTKGASPVAFPLGPGVPFK